jgi:hypothetical protein
MVWWKGKIGPCARWLGRCSTSIGLREGSRLRRSIPLVEELLEPWGGVSTYDALSGKKFGLHAAVL